MKISLLFMSMCILVSCTHNEKMQHLPVSVSETQIVDLNKYFEQPEYSQHDVIDSIKNIVFLETTDESLVYTPISIEVTDDRIYIGDLYQGLGLIIFDRNGKFIKRMLLGSEPGQVPHISDFAFDKYANQLLVYGNPSVYIFDADGNYIDAKTSSFSADRISVTADEYLFGKIPGHPNPELDAEDNYAVIVTDKDLNVKHLMCPHPSDRNSSLHNGHIGDNMYISLPDCDTIYYYGNHQLTAKYALDYSTHKSKHRGIIDYTKPIEEDGFRYSGKYFETNNHQIINLDLGIYACTYYRNKRNGHAIGGRDKSYNVETEISVNSPITTYRNQCVSVGEPKYYTKDRLKSNQFVSEEFRQKLEAMDVEDNPYLVFYTLKDF